MSLLFHPVLTVKGMMIAYKLHVRLDGITTTPRIIQKQFKHKFFYEFHDYETCGNFTADTLKLARTKLKKMRKRFNDEGTMEQAFRDLEKELK